MAALTEMLSSGSDEECPVCFEPLRQPVITVCSHVFCKRCVGRLLEAGQGPGPAAAAADGAQCPLCRGPVRAGQLVEVPEGEQQQKRTEEEVEKDVTEDDLIPEEVISGAKVGLQEGLKLVISCPRLYLLGWYGLRVFLLVSLSPPFC